MEDFQPRPHHPPYSLMTSMAFACRMFLDLQLFTIFLDLRRVLPEVKGRVLDVGCGNSPWKFLLPRSQATYVGIDYDHADEFAYSNPEAIRFDGTTIPFSNEDFDTVLCTEVLEHVYETRSMVREILRVLKPGGRAVITIPWSARWHYIPVDYFRCTPSACQQLLSDFSRVSVSARGSDLVVIGNKIFVVWLRSLIPSRWFWTPMSIVAFLASPLIFLLALFCHFSLLTGLGSKDDPLGWTIIAEK